jgi:hypothetical protein
VFFEEPGPSSITKAIEDSEYADDVDDFVWHDLLIDVAKDDDMDWWTHSR